MKKRIRRILSVSLLMAVSLMLPALGEDAQIPILIDGVPVAFFDAQGNLLSQKMRDDMVYVPLQSFCESLGLEAEVQGQSVSVDGKRIGMFDAAGNYIAPMQFGGVDYVPLIAFCEANALHAADEDGKILITRAKTSDAVVETKEAIGKVALHPYNFGDYFSYDIQEQNFKAVQTRYQLDGGFLYCNEAEVDYVLTCNARSAFEIENVSFSVSADVWEADAMTSGIRGVSFSEDMPANGSLTKTKHQTGSALVSAGLKATEASLEKVELSHVSGCIIMSKEKADTANRLSFEKAERLIAQHSYEEALTVLKALNAIDYPGADKLQKEATEGLQNSIKQEEERKSQLYQQAKELEAAKDYAAAAEIYESLGYYADSQTRLQECGNIVEYERALAFEQNCEFAKAKEIYGDLGTFKDAKSRMLHCEEILLPCEDIGSFSEGLAAIKKEGKYGYVDIHGNMVIARQFDSAGTFVCGLARVCKNEKWGYIDKTGQMVVPCQYDIAYSFIDGVGLVENDGKYGMVDVSGNLIIPCIYDSLTISEGLVRVVKDNKAGFINTAGEIAIPFEYKVVYDFHEGFAVVLKDSVLGFIDTSGNMTKIQEKNCAIFNPFFSEGLIRVRNEKLKIGFADTSGKVVIPCQFDDVGYFHDGLAYVMKDDAWGLIDRSGNWLVTLPYQPASRPINGIICALNNGKYGFIGTDGKPVLDFVFDNFTTFSESNGYYRVQQDGKYGVVNPNGKLEIPCEYSVVRYYSGYYTMIKDGKFYIQKAEEVIPRTTVIPESANPVVEKTSNYTTLKPGSKGQAVLDARMKLYELGYFSKKPTQTEYTNNMMDYVKKFEKDHGLKQDGILSPEDQEVLFGL